VVWGIGFGVGAVVSLYTGGLIWSRSSGLQRELQFPGVINTAAFSALGHALSACLIWMVGLVVKKMVRRIL
jgi:hypothetical protein